MIRRLIKRLQQIEGVELSKETQAEVQNFITYIINTPEYNHAIQKRKKYIQEIECIRNDPEIEKIVKDLE